jgi:6-phosphogluconolactonase
MEDRIAYVSCAQDRQIAVLAMNPATGALRDVAVVTVPGTDGPASSMPLALRPDRAVLYAATRSAPFQLSSFAVDSDGMLSLIGTAPAVEQFAYLTTDRSGRHVLAASYGGALVTSNPTDTRGMARAPATQVMQTPPKAHSIIPDPSNRFLLAVSLGGDCILRLAFDADAGTFQPLAPVATKPGSGPRHLRFSPNGRFLYLINELDGTINAYAFDDAQGGLTELQSISLLPPGVTGPVAAADIQITPDGRFLYGSERTTNLLTGFVVDPATGKLSPINAVPTNSAPRGFAIDPSGHFLLCAEQATRSLAMFAIDQKTGALARIGAHTVGGGPNWITFLD